MGMRMFWGLLLIAALIGVFFVAQHYRQEKQMADGAVNCTGCMTPDEKARFDKENSGDVADGQSEHKIRTYREEEAAGNPQGAQAAGQTTTTAAPTATTTTPAPVAAPAKPNSLPAQVQSAATGMYDSVSGATNASLPSTDTVSPNPPNGARFTGSGAYQWYRQGNLTWRVDTANGASCIAFATLDEWRKPIVVSHGCGRGA